MINGKIRLKVGVIISITGVILTILSLLLPSADANYLRLIGYLFLICGAFLIYPEAKKINSIRTKVDKTVMKKSEVKKKFNILILIFGITMMLLFLLFFSWSVPKPPSFPQIEVVEVTGPYEMKVIDEDFSDYKFTAVFKNVGDNGYVDIGGGLKEIKTGETPHLQEYSNVYFYKNEAKTLTFSLLRGKRNTNYTYNINIFDIKNK